MSRDAGFSFRGRPLRPSQLEELAMAWRPVGGVLLDELREWARAAELSEAQQPRNEEDGRNLAALVDRWVRSPEGRAHGSDDRGAALWEVHVAGFEVIDPEAARLRGLPEFEALRQAIPRVAQSLSALADLHPWVSWMTTTNRAFPTDVVPRLFVRELGMFAHTHQHKPAWSWDVLLRDGGVDPLGATDEQTVRAQAVLREQLGRVRSVL